MFEARFDQGALLQKLIAALGEVIVDANFDADSSGISVQAMDTSHTCLVSAQIKADALAHFRADRPLTLGLNLPNLVKVLKCAGKDDAIALRTAHAIYVAHGRHHDALRVAYPKPRRVSGLSAEMIAAVSLTTRSPGFHPSTAFPTSAIVPPNSWPRTTG